MTTTFPIHDKTPLCALGIEPVGSYYSQKYSIIYKISLIPMPNSAPFPAIGS